MNEIRDMDAPAAMGCPASRASGVSPQAAASGNLDPADVVPSAGPFFLFGKLTGEGPYKLRNVNWAAVADGAIL